AKLQHPHILPLLDSGEAGGLLYYVMPLATGETLRERLSRDQQLPIDDTVRIACEVADALHYAHAAGIIHRDIKPENILLQGGHALVADFGIALAVEQAGGQRMTQTGLSLGTPQYMSPEQAMGEKRIGPRSDVYSLGAVTYEMITGEPPFSGATVQSIVAKVMTERPIAPHALRDTVPAAVENAVLKALAKLPADRFATTAEFAAALSAPYSHGAVTAPAERPRSRVNAIALAAAALFAALALWGWLRRPASTRSEPRRFSIVLPDSSPLVFVGPVPYAAGQPSLALSPDGKRLAYIGTHGGTTNIFVRELNDFTTTRLAGTDSAYHPFFSPDGRSIGFFVRNELKRIDVSGGPVTTIAPMDVPIGATWGADGYIVVAASDGRELDRVRATGGKVRRSPGVTTDRRNFPILLPGTPYALHSNQRRLTATNLETGALYMLSADGPVSLETASNRDVIRGTAPRYVAGHLLWMSVNGELVAAPFDTKTLKFTGPSVVVVSGVRRETDNGAGQYAISSDGVLAYVPGANADVGHLAWVYEGGRQDSLPFPPAMYGTNDISPDGRRIVIQVLQDDGRRDERILDLTRNVEERLRDLEAFQFSSVQRWTPDSKSLVYGASSSLASESFILRTFPDHPGVYDTLARGPFSTSATFTPSGDTIVVMAGDSTRVFRLYLLSAKQRSPMTPIGNSRGSTENPGISPDGKWLTYDSNENGDRGQVYAEPFPPTGRRIQITSDGGAEAQWSRQGDALFYRKGTRIYRLPVARGGDNPFGTPRVFADGQFAEFSGRTFSVHPDGKRVLLKIIPTEQTSREIHVHTDLIAELERLDAARSARQP
ncbi:MAG TPA: protein kinase, partial [Gemmatimonadaceae bacterium]|nr:protein kinase [Gemmatimonadaceae bacterium]